MPHPTPRADFLCGCPVYQASALGILVICDAGAIRRSSGTTSQSINVMPSARCHSRHTRACPPLSVHVRYMSDFPNSFGLARQCKRISSTVSNCHRSKYKYWLRCTRNRIYPHRPTELASPSCSILPRHIKSHIILLTSPWTLRYQHT